MSIRVVVEWKTVDSDNSEPIQQDLVEPLPIQLNMPFRLVIRVTHIRTGDMVESVVSMGIPNRDANFFLPIYFKEGSLRNLILGLVPSHLGEGKIQLDESTSREIGHLVYQLTYNVVVTAQYRDNKSTLYHLVAWESDQEPVGVMERGVLHRDSTWRHPDSRMVGLGIRCLSSNLIAVA